MGAYDDLKQQIKNRNKMNEVIISSSVYLLLVTALQVERSLANWQELANSYLALRLKSARKM